MSVLKRLERYILAFFKLGRIERLAKRADRAAQDNAARTEELRGALARETDDLRGALTREADKLQTTLSQKTEAAKRSLDQAITRQNAWINGRLAEQSYRATDLTRRLDQLVMARTQSSDKQDPQIIQRSKDDDTISEGFQLFLDSFYNHLENRLRGSREDILDRLRVYQPDVEAAIIRTNGKPVLDLGCGRGEWVELMHGLGVTATGVDLNAAQITEAGNNDLDVRKMDARTALAEAEDASLAVITAHHLIEHLPFVDVAWIARESLRVLAPGGLLIFETPNPRNVLVGATSFHNDPTHLRPLTDPVLSTLFETAGYYPVETRFLHPHERLDEFMNRSGFDSELAHLLFGPQDLAMIGQKPREHS